jgi:hypothetical protein
MPVTLHLYDTFLRFVVPAPVAVVSAATLKLYCTEKGTGIGAGKMKIFGLTNDNPVFSTYTQFNALTYTSAYVEVAYSSFTASAWKSVDVTDIVNEIAATGTLSVAGDYLGFGLLHNTTTSLEYVVLRGYDTSNSNAGYYPKIELTIINTRTYPGYIQILQENPPVGRGDGQWDAQTLAQLHYLGQTKGS